MEINKETLDSVAISSSCSSMNCVGDNHMFIFSGHEMSEGAKCLCGKKKYHYEVCPTCKQPKAVYLDVME